MLLFDMYYKLRSKTAHSHCDDIGVRYFSFNAAEESEKSLIGKNIVKIFVREKEYSFLLFANVVDFNKFS